jgi:hypothetical protein
MVVLCCVHQKKTTTLLHYAATTVVDVVEYKKLREISTLVTKVCDQLLNSTGVTLHNSPSTSTSASSSLVRATNARHSAAQTTIHFDRVSMQRFCNSPSAQQMHDAAELSKEASDFLPSAVVCAAWNYALNGKNELLEAAAVCVRICHAHLPCRKMCACVEYFLPKNMPVCHLCLTCRICSRSTVPSASRPTRGYQRPAGCSSATSRALP